MFPPFLFCISKDHKLLSLIIQFCMGGLWAMVFLEERKCAPFCSFYTIICETEGIGISKSTGQAKEKG